MLRSAARILIIALPFLAPPALGGEMGAYGPPLPAATPSASREQAPLGKPLKSASSPAPSKASAASADPAWLARMAGSLVLVLVLAVAALMLLKLLARARGGLAGAVGAGGRAPSGILEVLGRYPLTRGETLILLRIDRRVLLLSHAKTGKLGSSSGTHTLCEITDPEEVASILVKTQDDQSRSLSERFTSVLGRFERATDQALRLAPAPTPLPAVRPRRVASENLRLRLRALREEEAGRVAA